MATPTPTTPFVGEIRIWATNFAPLGWAFCNGQLLPISQNTALFSILGTTYGGNGTSNFALPTLQGAAPVQQGQGPGLTLRDLGQAGGEATVTLLASELPAHTHAAKAVAATGNLLGPAGRATAEVRGGAYADAANTTMSADALSPYGGGQPHNNLPPYLVLNFCIAMQGIFPPRT